MVQIQIVNRFSFSVGGDVGGKGIGVFQSFGHFVTDPTGEKSLPVMIRCNWSVGERIIRLRDGEFCVFWSPAAGLGRQGSVVSTVVRVMSGEVVIAQGR